jgi:hypothetical protein
MSALISTSEWDDVHKIAAVVDCKNLWDSKGSPLLSRRIFLCSQHATNCREAMLDVRCLSLLKSDEVGWRCESLVYPILRKRYWTDAA